MSNNKAEKPSFKDVIANLKKEMSEPRITRSAQVEIKIQSAATAKGGAKI